MTLRAIVLGVLLVAGCGDPAQTEDMASVEDLATAADLATNDLAADLARRPLDGGIREDGGRCPEYPRCMTPDDCCNGAISCIGIAGSPDGYGWCGAKTGEPCNYDPARGPVVYCYSGGVCANDDHLCR